MYHYFPISNYSNPNRGLCVINPRFHYTAHGNPISMHLIDPEHYPKSARVKGKTVDLDAVLRHEFGHGLGLPHDPKPGSAMSTPYSVLNEWLGERDIVRGIAKYGYKRQSSHILMRWLRYIRYRSEKY